ncbi:uncharacterized protein H6S33_006023 [Morchella sextelata]|uniref:uncharacterized protein n=1 Tax=Morchella sextelata TaxID=1174677 RepID=UPI001D052F16|nr:uncharacterized protein H6S33_006023 [Morchella sextelata]KAH0614137.1 hypothetical protein H6S33_006023 [Morchella sextelata]
MTSPCFNREREDGPSNRAVLNHQELQYSTKSTPDRISLRLGTGDQRPEADIRSRCVISFISDGLICMGNSLSCPVHLHIARVAGVGIRGAGSATGTAFDIDIDIDADNNSRKPILTSCTAPCLQYQDPTKSAKTSRSSDSTKINLSTGPSFVCCTKRSASAFCLYALLKQSTPAISLPNEWSGLDHAQQVGHLACMHMSKAEMYRTWTVMSGIYMAINIAIPLGSRTT